MTEIILNASNFSVTAKTGDYTFEVSIEQYSDDHEKLNEVKLDGDEAIELYEFMKANVAGCD